MKASSVEVLQRHDGYLCLRFPPSLRTTGFGDVLKTGLKALPAVQQLAWISGEGKLLVHFDPAGCTHAEVARCIQTLLPAAPQAEEGAAPNAFLARAAALRRQWIAATPERMRPIVESATTEKALTNFVNDIVAFYLIRTHWDLITRLWIKNPVKYGNAWLTVFYLVFLLVRYRKS